MEQLSGALRLSEGKQRRLRSLANERGVIAALALDQRTALRKMFADVAANPTHAVSADQLSSFKKSVSRALTPYASAILLDPEYGLEAAAQRKKGAGLLFAYETSGYDKSVPGRLPRLLENWSVARLRSTGADAIKVLLYYSPFSPNDINRKKQDWVAEIGSECLVADLPFFLELVSYDDDLNEKSAEFARIKPDVVTRSIEEFCKSCYHVDVLKVGVPVNMNFVESETSGPQQILHSRAEARDHFRRASEAATLPFIYLSEGISNDLFLD